MRGITIISILSLAGIGGLTALPAQAGPVYESQSGGTFSFYGRFNPAWIHFDDGEEGQGKLVDNDAAPSMVGFNITQPFGAYELNFNFETAFGFRISSAVSQLDEPDALHWDREQLRYVDFALKTPSYGTFYLGQGSMATDSVADMNIGLTTVANSLTIGDPTGGYFLRRSGGGLSDVSVSDAFDSYDGSRRGRIRYDSPSYAGFTLRAAYGRNILDSEDDDNYWDLALVYENELSNGIKLMGGVGYSVQERDDGDSDLKSTMATVSGQLPSGFNATLAVGDRKDAGNYYYGQFGYIGHWTDLGTTSMSIDYYKGNDMVTDGDSSKAWGVGLVQNLAKYNTDLYLGYRKYEYEDDISDFQQADSYTIGVQFTF